MAGSRVPHHARLPTVAAADLELIRVIVHGGSIGADDLHAVALVDIDAGVVVDGDPDAEIGGVVAGV